MWEVSLRFALGYALLLGGLAIPPLQPLVGGAVAALGAFVIQLGSSVVVPVSLGHGALQFRFPDGTEVAVPTLEHIRNLALFGAVVLATGSGLNRRTLGIVAVGSTALIVLDAVIVAAEVWQHVPESIPPNAALEVLTVCGVFHSTGAAGLFAAPVFVGALAALGPRAGRAEGAHGGARCPCGSGKKFKACCKA